MRPTQSANSITFGTCRKTDSFLQGATRRRLVASSQAAAGPSRQPAPGAVAAGIERLQAAGQHTALDCARLQAPSTAPRPRRCWCARTILLIAWPAAWAHRRRQQDKVDVGGQHDDHLLPHHATLSIIHVVHLRGRQAGRQRRRPVGLKVGWAGPQLAGSCARASAGHLWSRKSTLCHPWSG